MWFNATGVENTAFGEQALGGSIDGSYNTAVGCRSLWSVVHTDKGDDGYGHGIANTALGYESIKNITNGNWNLGVGVRALETNSSGCNNVAIGGNALSTNTTGSNNTAIGHGADVGSGNLTNATAIGYNAKATANNQIFLGNSSVTSIRSYAAFTTISDARIKKDVQANIPGLIFINKLRPVTYHLDWDAIRRLQGAAEEQSESERLITGFIAQEVETAAKSVGYDFSGIDIEDSENHLYGLRYSKLVVPLVKAVQELSNQNEALSATIDLLQRQVEILTESVNKLTGENNSTAINETSVAGASLGQNYPNPSNQSTTITYTLPQNFNFAKIFITDTSGKILKQQPISGSGENRVTIDTYSLPQGTYYYTLCVDNMPVSTKKMIIKK